MSENDNNIALVLTIGLATEPSIKRINQLKPQMVYFIHSKKSKENALFIIEETNITNYKFKELDDHESVDDAFIKSLECIGELKDQDYEVIGDFTVGTKPMVAGLVMACIEEKIEYKYLGESDEDSREDGMGPVKSGHEKTKDQENPYENYAINEFKSGKEFFDKYQFIAARENFIKAESKLKYSDLKERSKLFIRIVEFYDSWDKFNDEQKLVKESNIPGFAGKTEFIKLNTVLEEILKDIKSDEASLNYFKNEIPNFYKQMKNNKLFLDRKLSSSEDIYKNIPYYLPDLLNNAYRRIEEGKIDDAIARLYRISELIAQIKLCELGLINLNTLESNKKFKIPIKTLEDKASEKGICDEVSSFIEDNKEKPYVFTDEDGNLIEKESKNLKIANVNSYKLLKMFGFDRVKEFEELYEDLKNRNDTILAHGLKPMDKDDTVEIYYKTKEFASLFYEDLDYHMELSQFPKLVKGEFYEN